VRPDDVYQVRIEQRSRALGVGFLIDPGFVVTSAEAVRDAGPAVELQLPDDAEAGPVATTPEAAGPDIASPDIASPDIASPDIASPDIASPDDAGETVTAEVIEVRGEDGLALLAVAKPGFRTLPEPAGREVTLDRPGHPPIPAPMLGDQLLRFRHLGAAGLRAALDGGTIDPLSPDERRPDQVRSERTDRPALNDAAGGNERAALLLDHLRERARSGRLDPVVTVPGLDAGEGSR
jgi:hypothetical protein